MMLKERDAYYDASYLIRVAMEGGPLFFKTDEEWLAYMTAAGIPDEPNQENDR